MKVLLILDFPSKTGVWQVFDLKLLPEMLLGNQIAEFFKV